MGATRYLYSIKKFISMTIIAVTILTMSSLSSCSPICNIEESQKIYADRKYQIFIMKHNCGATTGYSYSINILEIDNLDQYRRIAYFDSNHLQNFPREINEIAEINRINPYLFEVKFTNPVRTFGTIPKYDELRFSYIYPQGSVHM